MRPYTLPMMKTALFWIACLLPFLFGFKLYMNAVALHDDHVLTVARCMTETARELDISVQEAYIACEKEER